MVHLNLYNLILLLPHKFWHLPSIEKHLAGTNLPSIFIDFGDLYLEIVHEAIWAELSKMQSSFWFVPIFPIGSSPISFVTSLNSALYPNGFAHFQSK